MAFRLIFESDADGIRLARKSRVDMIAPAPPTEGDQRGPGVYAEVRNEREETMYRANISAQVGPTVEAFQPNAPVQRVAAPDQKRVVVLVVPDPPEARALVLVRRGGEGAAGGRFGTEAVAAEEELARVPLLDEE